MERRRHPRRAQSVMITESVVDSQEDLAKFKVAMVSVTILQFLRVVGGSLQTFEEGAWAAWLHDLLKPHITRMVVSDPCKTSLGTVRNKNDRNDAHEMAELL